MKAPPRVTCDQCDQRECGLSAGLEPSRYAALERDKSSQLFRAGQTLFCEGGPPHAIYCVRSGMVKLYKVGLRGEPLVLRFCGPGSVLGLRAAVAGEMYESTAEAVEDTVVCALPRPAFEALVNESPRMAMGLMRRLAIEVRESHERIEELAHCGVRQRAAHLLLAMHEPLAARRAPATSRWGRIKRMDLAAMIGTAPETMYRVLNELRQRGIIRLTRDTIEVLDPARLRTLAHEPDAK